MPDLTGHETTSRLSEIYILKNGLYEFLNFYPLSYNPDSPLFETPYIELKGRVFPILLNNGTMSGTYRLANPRDAETIRSLEKS